MWNYNLKTKFKEPGHGREYNFYNPEFQIALFVSGLNWKGKKMFLPVMKGNTILQLCSVKTLLIVF